MQWIQRPCLSLFVFMLDGSKSWPRTGCFSFCSSNKSKVLFGLIVLTLGWTKSLYFDSKNKYHQVLNYLCYKKTTLVTPLTYDVVKTLIMRNGATCKYEIEQSLYLITWWSMMLIGLQMVAVLRTRDIQVALLIFIHHWKDYFSICALLLQNSLL